MKQTLKTMAGALALGFLFVGGCTVGAVATGMLVPRGQSEARWAQAQVAESNYRAKMRANGIL